jgi:hypothetical protein
MKASPFVLAASLAVAPLARAAEEPRPLPSLAERTRGMTRMEGFLNLYWDEAGGRLFLELEPSDREFLYQESLASGLGSNPVGLDRGQPGATHLLRVERVGPRVLLVERNLGFRARTANADEVRAVEDAFASSVYWGFKAEAETDGRVLVDASDFFLRDAHGAARTMERAGQGTFELDQSRSAFYLPRTRAFPRNSEVETLLTFTSAKPGPLVRSVAVNPEAVTLREHYSFVALPDAGYRPRVADPRIGTNTITFYDYAAPIDGPLAVQWATRHRLQKKDPRAARSEPVAPIVYYLDRGVPEPVRSALLEGASWWKDAFAAAGFENAFRVELLPEGADPMDIRYNVILWTHRSTRGWSYGSSIVDPRSGEIVRGVVNLGSLRLRQDYTIAQGLRPPFASAGALDSACGLSSAPGFSYLAEATGGDAVELALARVRQLAAHEVGHTLGFPHNYIASTYGRASVMDYPAPLVRVVDGKLDLSQAYARGIGEYDKQAVKWLYSEFPPGTDEKRALEDIVADGLRRGLRFMDHTDNAFVGAGHEKASVWDNGSDLVEELARTIEVRRIGLLSFGASAVRPGEPLADLARVLVPLYLHHRFQMAAAAQSLGGADYSYALRGDGQVPLTIVPAAKQRRALGLILQTLDPDFLALPPKVLALLSPEAPDAPPAELFPSHTGLLFDPLAAAATAADLTVQDLLHPQRLARLAAYSSLGDYPGVGEVADGLIAATWGRTPPADPYRAQLLTTARRVALDRLIEQAEENPVAQVRATLTDRLLALAARLETDAGASADERLAAADIRRFEHRPAAPAVPVPNPEAPPGSPIGGSS